MKKEKLILIDGNSLMHRAFHSVPQHFANSKGLHTNVIYGFINMLNKLLGEMKPEYIAIAFDRKAPTFRHQEYSDYKANRKKMLPEMAEQIPVLKEVIEAMNIKQVELDGYEADDIIGTLSMFGDSNKIETIIVTGDRDAFQLISTNVNVLITKKGITDTVKYDEAKLMEDYEIRPDQVADMKGLMGDASDNIPGVPGIGEKTALDLIKQFDKLEEVLNNAETVKKNKVRENLIQYKEQAIFSKKLATIIRDVPVDVQLDDFKAKECDLQKLYEIYSELEFKNLIDKLPMPNGEVKEQESLVLNIVEFTDSKTIEAFVNKVREKGQLAFKICWNTNKADSYIFACIDERQCYFKMDDTAIDYVKELMEDEAVDKISHDIKQDILVLKQLGIDMKPVSFDTMIAAYVLNPSKNNYSLSDIYFEICGIQIENYQGKGADTINSYCGGVKAIFELNSRLHEELKKLNMLDLYYQIELPLVSVLADMEQEGFKVDKSMLEKLSIEFSTQIDSLTDSIYLEAGEQFNINSTKQLGAILFDKLGLPVIKKTKTGYSTDVEVLEALIEKHPIIEKILEYRQLVKLKSTYVDGLINIINPVTGKIHSKLNQTVTATGRLSSTEPNLQNIPIKTENGRQIRKVFIPTNDDYILVDADYSQIELRVLAHISDDPSFIDAFVKNQDIHTRTASEVFGVPIDEVTPIMRSRAKAVNFGIVYGISDFGLSKDLNITKKEAKMYIDNYLNRYPGIKIYMDKIVAQAKEKGYVTTIMNRMRYIPEISSKNAIQRNFGERMAMNTPIQGSAADIIKIAMVKVYKELTDKKLRSKLILQVHDELIVETHKTEVEIVKALVKKCMEEAYELKVPLTVDVNLGKNWYEAK